MFPYLMFNRNQPNVLDMHELLCVLENRVCDCRVYWGGGVLDRSRTTLRPFVDLVSSRVQQCRYLGAETREVGTGPKEEVI